MSNATSRLKFRAVQFATGLLIAGAAIVPASPVAPGAVPSALAAAADVGYRDFSFADAPGGDDVTAGSVQSKLWYNDGSWFGVLFDPGGTLTAKYRIWRFNMTTQAWTNTGVAVDDRNRSHADVVAYGNNLYVASSHSAGAIHFFRYTYDPATHAYALAAPSVSIANTSPGTGYVSLARAANGGLWMVFPQKNAGVANDTSVYYSYGGTTGATWTTPAVLPAQASTILDEDLAAITPVTTAAGDGVGVLWGDQKDDDAYYFSVHLNGSDAGTWSARETAYSGANIADNHINVKTDPSGRVIAVVKTGKTGPTDPLIVVLRRSAGGTWETHTVSNHQQDGTRPLILLDEGANQAAVYMTSPALTTDGQRKLYRHTAPLDTLNFGTASLGSVVIANSVDPALNDVTSTKQVIDGNGQLVEVADATTLRYLHSCLGGPCPAKPVANFSATPTSGAAPLLVTFTDTSTNGPTSWSWNFGDGGTSTAKNPTHTYSAPGTYNVSLTATNSAGSDTVTKTGYITVTPSTDHTPPTVSPIYEGFYVRSTLGATVVTTKLSWSASDPSGISKYRLQLSTTSATGPWINAPIPSDLSRSVVRTLYLNKQYWFRVLATDGVGNSTPESTPGQPVKITKTEQTSSAIIYSGTWRTYSSSSATGGSLKYTTTHLGYAQYKFTGRSIGWVGWTGPTRGIAEVSLDGKVIRKIDLWTSTARVRQVLFSGVWSVTGTHTIKVRLVGTGSRWREDVDAFVVGH